MAVLSKTTRSVWVGFLQLDEYDESISVHDEVKWQVSALSEGFLDGALPEDAFVDFELDRYADVMGLARAQLAGTVARIRWVQYPVSMAPLPSDASEESLPSVSSVYSTKEPMGRMRQDREALVVQRAKASPGFSGFVVDVVLDRNSEELESLRVRLPVVPGVPWPESG
ncbi:hypothetical protein [Frondihabitans peucedani]|uniref:hypothetical protein n=1 Tax=Frondihabitans peucedani TaxID=598626 RepID=UPI0031E2536C